jgi:hypothetical protein
MVKDTDVIVVGAGPFGLSAGAALRKSGLNAHVVGDVMSFWQQDMPRGLKLRSPIMASHIGDKGGPLTLHAFAAETGASLESPLAVETFVGYGKWFQAKTVADVDGRRVRRVERRPSGFLVTFDDGDTLESTRVVVAAGIDRFPWVPPQFEALVPSVASHSAHHSSLDRFAGARVIVVGGGQSALESAAQLHEAGAASVEVLIRRPTMRILIGGRFRPYLGPLSFIAYPAEDVGPPGINLFTVRPNLFKQFPRPVQTKMARRAIRPAGASWLVPRLEPVTVTTSVTVADAAPDNGSVHLRLSDGSARIADHMLFATGFRIDVRRYEFVPPELAAALRLVDGYPVLDRAFQSSVPGLHFLGAPAAWSFGPLMRFVSGTWFTTRSLMQAIGARKNGR